MNVKLNDQPLCTLTGFNNNERTKTYLWTTSGLTPGSYTLSSQYGGHEGCDKHNLQCCEDNADTCYASVVLHQPVPTITPTPIPCSYKTTLSIKNARGELITGISGFSHLWQIFQDGKLIDAGVGSIPSDQGIFQTSTASLNPKYRNGTADITLIIPSNFAITGRWCTNSSTGGCPDTSGNGATLSGFNVVCDASYDYGWYIHLPEQYASILKPEARSTVSGNKVVFKAATPINPNIKRVWLKHISDPVLPDDPPTGWIARANGAPEVVGDKYLWTGDYGLPNDSHAWDTTNYPDGTHFLQAVALTSDLGTIVESDKILVAVRNNPVPTSMPIPTPIVGIINGGFEDGFANWFHGGGNKDYAELPQSVVNQLSNGEAPYQGNLSALLGDPEAQCIPQTRLSAWMYQDVTIPNVLEPVYLTFAYRIFTHDTIDWSDFRVQLLDINNNILTQILRDGLPGAPGDGPQCSKDLGWKTLQYDLNSYKGQTVRLRFSNVNIWPGQEWWNSHGIWTYIDDVKLQIGPQPITSPTPITQSPSSTPRPPH